MLHFGIQTSAYNGISFEEELAFYKKSNEADFIDVFFDDWQPSLIKKNVKSELPYNFTIHLPISYSSLSIWKKKRVFAIYKKICSKKSNFTFQQCVSKRSFVVSKILQYLRKKKRDKRGLYIVS